MSADIVKMIGNLSQSLSPVQDLIAGFGYLLSFVFFWHAISKLKKIGDSRARGGSQEKMFIPIAYMIAATALAFLPSTLTALSKTAFGTDSILQYAQYDPYNVYNAMKMLIQTAGLIWFVRGSVLLAHASEPGVQEGPKGFVFLISGILAMNIEGTTSALQDALDYLMHLSSSI